MLDGIIGHFVTYFSFSFNNSINFFLYFNLAHARMKLRSKLHNGEILNFYDSQIIIRTIK
jgi:hypothetical protein